MGHVARVLFHVLEVVWTGNATEKSSIYENAINHFVQVGLCIYSFSFNGRAFQPLSNLCPLWRTRNYFVHLFEQFSFGRLSFFNTQNLIRENYYLIKGIVPNCFLKRHYRLRKHSLQFFPIAMVTATIFCPHSNSKKHTPLPQSLNNTNVCQSPWIGSSSKKECFLSVITGILTYNGNKSNKCSTLCCRIFAMEWMVPLRLCMWQRHISACKKMLWNAMLWCLQPR